MTIIPENAIQINGGYFDYSDIKSNKFDLFSYVDALRKLSRFNGHADSFWSVLNHLILTAKLAIRQGESPKIILHALLHDVHEAMYVDIPRPLKRYIRNYYNFDWNILSKEFDEWLFENVGLEPLTEYEHKIIKHYDNWSLILEKRQFFKEQMDWGWGEDYPDVANLIDSIKYIDSSVEFFDILAQYKQLYKQEK